MIRAKKNAIALTAFFIILVGIGEFTDWLPLGRVWKSKQQNAVQDCRVNILTTPDLQKVDKKITTIDRYANVEQVGKSAFFRVETLGKKTAFYKLTEPDYQFVQVADLVSMQPFALIEFKIEKGKLKISVNDKLATSLPLDWDKSTVENTLIQRTNSETAAFIVKMDDKSDSVAYLADLNKPRLELVKGLSDLQFCAGDNAGANLIAVDKKGNVFRVEIEKNLARVKPVCIYNDQIDDIKYSAKAEALLILDRTQLKLTVLDARTGIKRGILSFEKGDIVNVISGTEGGLVDNELIDLVTGQVVEELPGFCKKSIFAVDFANKRLYYSSCDLGSKNPAKAPPTYIASYDLHEMKMETQVDLGEKSAGAEEKLKREDEVKSIFLDHMNRLIILTVPI
ncbi:MAG: hypothetical protein KIT34_07655 [Cyanobacteria bacterium TGS_CYA1]|nr:hypothetical protein [Cyanobacteria bacterium TGS_CYA1]